MASGFIFDEPLLFVGLRSLVYIAAAESGSSRLSCRCNSGHPTASQGCCEAKEVGPCCQQCHPACLHSLTLFGSVLASIWTAARAGKLAVTSTPNQDNPLMKNVVEQAGIPVLGLDVWEHA